MWDWDAIDADYFTNSSGGQAAAAVPGGLGGVIGPPAILSAGHQLRPSTSAGEGSSPLFPSASLPPSYSAIAQSSPLFPLTNSIVLVLPVSAVAAPGDFEYSKGGALGLFNSSRGSRGEEEDDEGGYGSNAK